MLTCLGVFFVFYAPLQFLMSRYFNTLRQKVSKITDKRVRVMNEVLSAMKLVKLYNWEQSFAEKVRCQYPFNSLLVSPPSPTMCVLTLPIMCRSLSFAMMKRSNISELL